MIWHIGIGGGGGKAWVLHHILTELISYYYGINIDQN